MPKMTVYHGGYMPVKEPEIDREKNTKDFGPDSTRTVIRNRRRWREDDTKIVSVYDVRLNTKLNHQRIFHDDRRMAGFYCRMPEWTTPHSYDIVIGAMADDQIYSYISDFIDGSITREQFWVLAKFKYPTHQINFCTEDAFLEVFGI